VLPCSQALLQIQLLNVVRDFCRLNVEDSGEDENSEHKSSKESTESVSACG